MFSLLMTATQPQAANDGCSWHTYPFRLHLPIFGRREPYTLIRKPLYIEPTMSHNWELTLCLVDLCPLKLNSYEDFPNTLRHAPPYQGTVSWQRPAGLVLLLRGPQLWDIVA